MKKPAFRTVDILGLIILVGLMTGISGAIVAQTLQNDRPQRAKAVAKTLAQQIRAEQSLIRQDNSGQRGPASEAPPPMASLLTLGRIGHDPWGNPYRYFVQRPHGLSSGSQTRQGWVYVWSDGPDGRSSTQTPGQTDAPSEGRFALGGDDIGHVESFPLEP